MTEAVASSLDALYRNESARLLAVLTRILGSHNLELAEDTLQDAFSKAMTHWQENGIPDKPAAWIMQTAKNRAIDCIRANKTKTQFSQDLTALLESEWSLGRVVEQEFREGKIKDDQLRMIFMCCHESLQAESRIPFILKTLCGFSLHAIARAMLIPEATIKKRLQRTRKKLQGHHFEFPSADKLLPAMDSVHTVLYLIFNEGFYSSEAHVAVKLDFCREAMRLLNILIDEPRIVNQDSFSLYALMHFHSSRLAAKVDKDGIDIPIDQQDRSLWDKGLIAIGEQLLAGADTAPPGASGRFYWEAKIAREHCKAAAFEDTNWPEIADYYQRLIEVTGSSVARLNQALAFAYGGALTKGIAQVESLAQDKTLQRSHMPSAVLAHLYAKAGRPECAYQKAEEAKGLGGTVREHQMMMAQLERILKNAP